MATAEKSTTRSKIGSPATAAKQQSHGKTHEGIGCDEQNEIPGSKPGEEISPGEEGKTNGNEGSDSEASQGEGDREGKEVHGDNCSECE